MIVTYITIVAVGALLCVFGVLNMMGNISSIHWYHRKRITEETRKPFGRLVGGGTLTVGISVILYAALLWAYDKTQMGWIMGIALAVLFLGIAAGLALSFYGMIKYNKGIF